MGTDTYTAKVLLVCNLSSSNSRASGSSVCFGSYALLKQCFCQLRQLASPSLKLLIYSYLE